MAKKTNTFLILGAAAAGAWWLFSDQPPTVDYSLVDWLRGTAQITVDGSPVTINNTQDYVVGKYSIGFENRYIAEQQQMGPGAIVIRKNGAVISTVVTR
jgi:hypothetical protein